VVDFSTLCSHSFSDSSMPARIFGTIGKYVDIRVWGLALRRGFVAIAAIEWDAIPVKGKSTSLSNNDGFWAYLTATFQKAILTGLVVPIAFLYSC